MQIFFLALLLLLNGCCRSPCSDSFCVEGAAQFVLDSYQISEGKASILALDGIDVPPLPSNALLEYQDQIDEDDILRLAIYHPTRNDLAQAIGHIGQAVGYRVVNGHITLPKLGAVKVKGLTLKEAEKRVIDHYHGEIEDIEIFLEYQKRLHSKVELMGAVQVPEVPVNGRIRLYEVLSLAGVPPNANLFKSYVARGGTLLPIDLSKLVLQGDMSQNIVMRPGDKVFIADPMSASIAVMGEVGFAKVIPVPTGSISLREALAAAGGIPFTGNKRCIQVIRGSVVCPKIYRLSWNHIAYLRNESLLLIPGDTVYISEKPITRWNRFIEQLLPSSLLIDLGIKTRGVFY